MLCSVDPARNRFRFYELEVEPHEEAAEVLLTVRWGRIGQAGRVEVHRFHTVAEAEAEARQLTARRLKRGYVEVDPLAGLRTADGDDAEESGGLVRWQAIEARLAATLRRARRELVARRERLARGAAKSRQLALFRAGLIPDALEAEDGPGV